MSKHTKLYSALHFMGHTFQKESTEDRVKLLESKCFKLLTKGNNG